MIVTGIGKTAAQLRAEADACIRKAGEIGGETGSGYRAQAAQLLMLSDEVQKAEDARPKPLMPMYPPSRSRSAAMSSALKGAIDGTNGRMAGRDILKSAAQRRDDAAALRQLSRSLDDLVIELADLDQRRKGR